MQTSYSPQDAAQALRQSLEKSFAQNTALFAEMAHFTRAESLRMAQRNLDRAHHAFSRLEEQHNLAGLIGAQQEWIRETMQDYATRSLHYADMFRGLAQDVHAQARQAATDFASEAQKTTQEIGEKSEAVMHEAQRAAE